MKTITLKIIKDDNKGHSRIDHLLNEFDYILSNGPQYSIGYHTSLSIEDIKKSLIEKYGEKIETRDSVSGGCYGARDGKTYKGLTVYVDSSLFEDRFIDSDFDEIVNIEKLCEDYGELLSVDAEEFENSMEAAGVEGKRDNTYNYLGNDSASPQALSHADFTLYEINEQFLVSVKFHCGGDIRGNYTENVVYKFEDCDDFYSAFCPTLYFYDEDDLEEVERLKHLISCDPEDKKLLIKELNEFIRG